MGDKILQWSFVALFASMVLIPLGCFAWEVDTGGTLSNDLVSYWPLDEKTGVRADAVGLNNMTPESSPGWVTSTVGNLGRAATFDGTDDCLKISDASQTGLDFAYHDFSYQAWIKASDAAGTPSHTILARDKVGSRNLLLVGLEQVAGENIYFYINDTYAPAAGYTEYGAWTHIIITFDYIGAGTSVQKFYLNGSLVSTKTNASGMTDSTGDFQIGAREYTTSRQFWYGNIMHVAAWNRTLTADEVAELYNDGDGNSYLLGQTPVIPSQCLRMPSSTQQMVEFGIPFGLIFVVFLLSLIAFVLVWKR